MDATDLEAFAAIVASGSLAGGGRRLGRSAMAMTRGLASLEAGVGVRLIHRTTRAIALTPEGETFLPYARAILDLKEQALDSLIADPNVATGKLKVTCPHVLGRGVLVPVLHQLQHEQPALSVELILSDELLDIVDEGIDVGIRLAHPKDSQLIGHRLAENPRALYASPAYLKERGKPVITDDLSAHLGVRAISMTAWPFLAGSELKMINIPGKFACSSAEGVKEACLQGMGLALLSYWDVEQELRAGSLERVHLSDASAQNLPIWAMTPTKKNVPSRVRMLVKKLRAYFDMHSYEIK